MRIKGMGKGYVGLLQEVGVDTVRELQLSQARKSCQAMAEANKRKRMVRFLPPEKLVVRWIEHAKKLPLKISYKDQAEGPAASAEEASTHRALIGPLAATFEPPCHALTGLYARIAARLDFPGQTGAKPRL